jgi:hypothetical protein
VSSPSNPKTNPNQETKLAQLPMGEEEHTRSKNQSVFISAKQ